MNLITRKTDYAIRAICYIAKAKEDTVSTAELEKHLKLPRPFMRKIFQTLTKNNILNSFKGKGGGFALVKAKEEIKLTDLIKIFQGRIFLDECFFKKKLCPNIRNCILRKKIKKIEDAAIRQLEAVTIGELLKQKGRS